MIIGVPREVKDHESRVGLVPHGVSALVEAGHEVSCNPRRRPLLHPRRGIHSSAARIVPGRRCLSAADIVVKVKNPNPPNSATSARI